MQTLFSYSTFSTLSMSIHLIRVIATVVVTIADKAAINTLPVETSPAILRTRNLSTVGNIWKSNTLARIQSIYQTSVWIYQSEHCTINIDISSIITNPKLKWPFKFFFTWLTNPNIFSHHFFIIQVIQKCSPKVICMNGNLPFQRGEIKIKLIIVSTY